MAVNVLDLIKLNTAVNAIPGQIIVLVLQGNTGRRQYTGWFQAQDTSVYYESFTASCTDDSSRAIFTPDATSKTSNKPNTGLPTNLIASASSGGSSSSSSGQLSETQLQNMILGWAASSSYIRQVNTRTTNGVVSSKSITWPDGASGIWTNLTPNTDYPDESDSWTVTYTNGTTKYTVTQPPITRDSATGYPITSPALTIGASV